MKVQILYDNRALPGYQADWGFSCLLTGRETTLFDTGASPSVLERNMTRAGVRPETIDRIVISHDHWDHTGGLPYISARNASASVFILPSFGQEVRAHCGELAVEEVDSPRELSPELVTTGPVAGAVPEQALGLRTAEGLLVLTGCAHPGVDALIEAVRAFGPVCGVLGGFHGFARLEALAGIPLLAPCHCTQRLDEIAARFPETYRQVAAGSVLELQPAAS